MITTISITPNISNYFPTANLHGRMRQDVATQDVMAFATACAHSKRHMATCSIREIGGAPGNPAHRSHFSVRIVRCSGRRCTDACGRKKMWWSAHPS